MFSWFSTKEEKAFGLQLAEFVIKEIPLEIVKKKQDKTVLKRKKVMDPEGNRVELWEPPAPAGG